jgi:cytochrome c biogenesis protein CcmG, thiol:disulfide interchange protein DsbE
MGRKTKLPPASWCALSKIPHILLFAILLCLIPATLRSDDGLAAGDVIPTFYLKDINGNNFFLTDYLGEKASNTCRSIVFSFCASYCQPCKIEIPELEKLAVKYRDQGLRVFLVAIERQEQAQKLVMETATTLPVLIDRYLVVQKLLGFEGIPYTVLIDSKGVARFISTGFSEDHASEIMARFEQEVRACLAAGAATVEASPGAR